MRKIFLLTISLCSFIAAAELPSGPTIDAGLSLFPEGDLPELNLKELEELTKLFFPGEDEEKRKELIEETVKLDQKMRSMSKEERIAEQKKMEQELEQFLTQELAALEEEQPPVVEPKIPEAATELPVTPGTDKEKAAKSPTASAQDIAATKKMLKSLLEDIAQFRIKVSSLPRISKDVRVEQQWQQTITPLDEFESFAILIARKEHLLSILASQEFAMLKGQLTTLQQKVHSAINAVIVPDTFMVRAVTDDDTARAGLVDKKTEQQTSTAIKTTVNNLFNAVVSQQLGWSLKRLLQKYAPEELKKVESPTLKDKEKAGKPTIEIGPSSRSGGFGGMPRRPSESGAGFGRGATSPTGSGKVGPVSGPTGKGEAGTPPAGGGKGAPKGADKGEDKGKKEGDKDKGKESDKSKDGKKDDKSKSKDSSTHMSEFDKALQEAASLITKDNLVETVAGLETVRENDIRETGKTLSPLAIQLSGSLLPKAQKLQAEIVKADEKEQSKLFAQTYEKLNQAIPLQLLEKQLNKTLSVRPISRDDMAAQPIFEIGKSLSLINSLLIDQSTKELIEIKDQARKVASIIERLPDKDREPISQVIQQIMALDPTKGEAKERAKLIKSARSLFADTLAVAQPAAAQAAS